MVNGSFVGTIQATLPCDLETHLMSLTWPRVLALV